MSIFGWDFDETEREIKRESERERCPPSDKRRQGTPRYVPPKSYVDTQSGFS